MLTLQGVKIRLRALEPSDLEFLYILENDESHWELSSTQTPYSRQLLKQYLNQAHQDIYEAKQLRLAICQNISEDPIGLIDLFDFNPLHRRAGVGILIANKEDRSQGFGKEALDLVSNYARQHLKLHQLYANIAEGNDTSVLLFESRGFTRIGVKKDWNFIAGKFQDELLYQLRYVH